jgi:hypothetical protein
MSRPETHTVSENLKNWILQLPEVVEAPHRFGGTQFQVNGLEFMHFHGDTFLDIRLSKEDQATMLDQGIVIPHRFAPQAGWVSFRIENAEDVERAKNIVQMAYANARSRVARKSRTSRLS